MTTPRRVIGPLLPAAALVLSLMALGTSPAAALTQSLSIRPTSGSAIQRITITFVAESCGGISWTDEATWDGQPFIVFGPQPPSCRYVFSTTPLEDHRNPGKHRICAGAGADTTYFSCATYTVLAPKPKPTPKPAPKAVPSPTPTSSPTPAATAPATPTALALETATPTPAPAPPTTPGATPVEFVSGAGGAMLDLTPLLLGAAVFLVLLLYVIVMVVRRARVLPPPR